MQETRLDTARIRAARRVIDPVFLGTPLYRCEALEPVLGCAVSIKLETANPVRSFKARGTEVIASQLAGSYAGASSNIERDSLLYLGLILLVISFITNMAAQVVVRRFDRHKA